RGACLLLAEGISLRIQRRAEVAFAEVRQNRDDQLARVLGSLRHLHGDMNRGAGADAGENPFLARQKTAHHEGVVVLDLNHLVDVVHVVVVGDEAGAEALNAVAPWYDRLPGLLLRDDRAGDWLDGDGLEARLALLDDLADAGDRAAGANAGDEDVDLAIGVAPDLLGRGAAAKLAAGRGVELLRAEGSGPGRAQPP